MKKVVTILLVLLAFAVGGCSSKQEPPAASTQKPQQTQAPQESPQEKPAPLKKKAAPRLVDISLVATSEENLITLTRFCIDENQAAVIRMIKRGEAFTVDGGTRVIILERGVMVHHIEIDEGPSAGKRGYVPSEFVE